MHHTGYTTSRPVPLSGAFYAALLGFAALVFAGLYAIFVQMRDGLGVTGLNNYVTWGLYIVSFEFFVGVSTGAILIAAAVYGLRWDRLRSVGRLAAFTAFVSLALAGLSILVSMGNPARAYTVLTGGRLGSPLVWDVLAITSSLVLFGAILHFATRHAFAVEAEDRPKLKWLFAFFTFGRLDASADAARRDERKLRWLSLLAIPWAIVLHSVTAWIFGLLKARPAWHSTLLAPLYVVSAVVSGIALVLLIAIVARWLSRAKPTQDAIQTLAKILLGAIPVLGYFLFAEMLTSTFSGGADDEPFFREMLYGQYAWVFWFNLIGGLLIPLVVLAVPALRRNELMLGAAAILVVLGVFAERFNLVVVPQFQKLLPMPIGSYDPTWVELTFLYALVGLLALAVMAMSRLIPMFDPEAERVSPPSR